MHILIVNDDGPPTSNTSCSPYIFPFVRALQAAGHDISVVIPDRAQSWISKAHLVGKALIATPLDPSTFTGGPTDTFIENGTGTGTGSVEWTLVNGTPASCTQLGLYHLTSHRGPVDLLISGPNWGRNVTTIYNLSSGTVGGAMEAAQCGIKAVALSFASKEPQPCEIIEAACRVAVRTILHLEKTWTKSTELYAINVPMIPDIDSHKVVYTRSLPSYHSRNSIFEELASEKNAALANGSSTAITNRDDPATMNGLSPKLTNGTTKINPSLQRPIRSFRWHPQLQDVQKSIDESSAGTDGWAMKQGYVSVTPMLATFGSVDHLYGEAVL